MYVRFHSRDYRFPDLWEAYEKPKVTRKGPLNNFNVNGRYFLRFIYTCVYNKVLPYRSDTYCSGQNHSFFFAQAGGLNLGPTAGVCLVIVNSLIVLNYEWSWLLAMLLSVYLCYISVIFLCKCQIYFLKFILVLSENKPV